MSPQQQPRARRSSRHDEPLQSALRFLVLTAVLESVGGIEVYSGPWVCITLFVLCEFCACYERVPKVVLCSLQVGLLV